MSESFKKYSLLIFTFILLFFAFLVIRADLQNSNKKFSFSMFDVGQGDSLLIKSPSGVQVLIDGGPSEKILSALKKEMPAFDRSLDAIIITNPDQDHIGGILDVLKVYKVGTIFESGTWSDSRTYKNLEEEIIKKKIPNILAKKGMKLDLGDGAQIDILFPDRNVTSWPTNEGSIVARLSYGNVKIMLTGDATNKTEDLILKENSKEKLQSYILKAGHHGSKYSSSINFLKIVSPEYALISVGKNNKYNHPAPEILGIFSDLGVKVLRTDQLGTIIVKCDKIGVCEINK
ncbi:MAG TPA: MBL fold metallo-hydrolase [Candidatus Paceibacterota bacterium]|nr:MBL fold metallo-hydrolase [Candidatus Paceibacterota bacterium]HPT18066.1 MBL fold metallo-hydrolase [Candidatus Paceibacterota bacterium]